MKLKDEIDLIMSELPPREDRYFSTNKYRKSTSYDDVVYIQHIPKIVEDTQLKFVKICIRELNLSNYNTEVHRQGIFGRLIDDSGNKILYDGWRRFMCIDSSYREWTQPHLAYQSVNSNYPTDADSVCINDKFPELITYFRDKKIETILK